MGFSLRLVRLIWFGEIRLVWKGVGRARLDLRRVRLLLLMCSRTSKMETCDEIKLDAMG